MEAIAAASTGDASHNSVPPLQPPGWVLLLPLRFMLRLLWLCIGGSLRSAGQQSSPSPERGTGRAGWLEACRQAEGQAAAITSMHPSSWLARYTTSMHPSSWHNAPEKRGEAGGLPRGDLRCGLCRGLPMCGECAPSLPCRCCGLQGQRRVWQGGQAGVRQSAKPQSGLPSRTAS